MKKLVRILIVAVILLTAGMVQAKDWVATLLGEGDTLMARFGYNVTDKIETGLETVLLADNVPTAYGAYGIMKFDAINIPNPIPLDFLPKEWLATPYAGVQVGMDFGNKGTFCGFIAGFKVGPMIVEYDYLGAGYQLQNANNSSKIVLGLKWEF